MARKTVAPGQACVVTGDPCEIGYTCSFSTCREDYDNDGITDSKDLDDDNDGKNDRTDFCPRGDLGWISDYASTDDDNDGCKDDGEDLDDDNDAVLDCGADGVCADDASTTANELLDNDACRLSRHLGAPEEGVTDTDHDGCSDDEDPDGDGFLNKYDSCPFGASSGIDTDNDGCKDDGEDLDDDNESEAIEE